MSKGLTSLLAITLFIALLIGYLIGSQSWLYVAFTTPLLFLGLFFSIRYIHKLVDEVQNKYHWYEQILDAVPTPLSVTDIEMNWTFINKPVKQLFGDPEKKFTGLACHNWGAGICKTENCGIWRLRNGHSETFFSQFDKEFRVDTCYLYDLKGETIGHVEVCTDVTALNAVTQAAKIAKESKNQAENAYRELQEAQSQLVEAEKMASLGALVAGVAHEINTPIGICVTANSIIEERMKKMIEEAQQAGPSSELLESINHISECNQMITLNLNRAIDLVKSFKQVAVDQSSEACYPFLIVDNLHQVIVSLKHELKKKNVQVNLDCDSSLIIDTYPGALAQIYTNLILNSIIHGFEATGHNNKIDIQIERQGRYVHIDYKDNGSGIDKEVLPKIFEPFVTTRKGAGGSGLGTAIIYNLITHKLKGEISCINGSERGCCFMIKLLANKQVALHTQL